jgi:hypothetical protein
MCVVLVRNIRRQSRKSEVRLVIAFLDNLVGYECTAMNFLTARAWMWTLMHRCRYTKK